MSSAAFTGKELDFITYAIKYRMGKDAGED